MVYLLGLGDDLVGVTHECDYPVEARLKPRVTRAAVDPQRDSQQIHRQVETLLHDHRSIYDLDLDRIRALRPDLILTQEICEVCAVSREQVQAMAERLYGAPNVVSLDPSTLEGVLQNIAYLGEVTGRPQLAAEQVDRLRSRVEAVREPSRNADPPKVVCIEWLEPLMIAGHWVPEMIASAGGLDPLAIAGEPSRRADWEEIRAAEPDFILIAPCGFSLQRAVHEYDATPLPDWWPGLAAVKRAAIYAIDGNAYTARPGPRLVDGLEIIATILSGRPVTDLAEGVAYSRLGS
jgi:iron complex transport system substrate-binding protein